MLGEAYTKQKEFEHKEMCRIVNKIQTALYHLIFNRVSEKYS